MFVIQQDIMNSSLYTRLKLSGEQRWNPIREYSTREEAEEELNRLLADKNLDNKRCPLRLIEVSDA